MPDTRPPITRKGEIIPNSPDYYAKLNKQAYEHA